MGTIATKRSEMTEGARESLNELDHILYDILEVKSSSLPEDSIYKNNKADNTSIKSILKKMYPKQKKINEREVSCKFEKKELVNATDDRLLALMTMAEQAENQEELCYKPDSDKLYRKQIEFTLQLMEWGCLSSEDFDTGD